MPRLALGQLQVAESPPKLPFLLTFVEIPRLILPRQGAASVDPNPRGSFSMTATDMASPTSDTSAGAVTGTGETNTGAATSSGFSSADPTENGAAGAGTAETGTGQSLGGGGGGMDGIATTSADNAAPRPTPMGQWIMGVGAGAAGLALGNM